MLVLTRKPGEAIVTNVGLVFRILEIKGSHIRIGIEAPKEITVMREELLTGAAPSGARFAPAPRGA